MTEETVVSTKRTRYPWKSLTEVGQKFVITSSNENGVKNIRQLIYSANKSAESKELGVRYQFQKQDNGDIVVERVQ